MEASISTAYDYTYSSSRRRRVSSTDTSQPPSSHRRQVSPIQAPEVPKSSVPHPTDVASELVPPPNDDASEPMPPLVDEVVEPFPSPNGEAGEVAEDNELEPPQEFGRGHVELSMLSLYPDHNVRHIWDGEVTLVGFILFNLCLLLYYKFMTLIYFYG